MKAKAQGQLRHKFHGTYSAIIVLAFNTEYEANEALKQLQRRDPLWYMSTNAKHVKPLDTTVLAWAGNSEQLDVCKEVLASFGADAKKIDSIAKSIDYGEPFDATFDVDAPEQTTMFT